VRTPTLNGVVCVVSGATLTEIRADLRMTSSISFDSLVEVRGFPFVKPRVGRHACTITGRRVGKGRLNGQLAAHGNGAYRKIDEGDSRTVGIQSKVQLLQYVNWNGVRRRIDSFD